MGLDPDRRDLGLDPGGRDLGCTQVEDLALIWAQDLGWAQVEYLRLDRTSNIRGNKVWGRNAVFLQEGGE